MGIFIACVALACLLVFNKLQIAEFEELKVHDFINRPTMQNILDPQKLIVLWNQFPVFD